MNFNLVLVIINQAISLLIDSLILNSEEDI